MAHEECHAKIHEIAFSGVLVVVVRDVDCSEINDGNSECHVKDCLSRQHKLSRDIHLVMVEYWYRTASSSIIQSN
eukprot:jgi/Psemu1/300096/fgenesh1_kg.6_\